MAGWPREGEDDAPTVDAPAGHPVRAHAARRILRRGRRHTAAENGGSETESPSESPADGGGADLTMVDFGFSPTDLSVTEGQTITVTNIGETSHTFTTDDEAVDETVGPGEEVEITLDRRGQWRLPLSLPPADDRNAHGRLIGRGASRRDVKIRSSADQTENESPQAHSCVACGLSIFSPPPRSASLNSRVEPRRSARSRVDEHPNAVRRLDHGVVLARDRPRTTGRR